MSKCRGHVTQEGRPHTGRVRVNEQSGSGHTNPTPVPKPQEESDTGAELQLRGDATFFLEKLLHGTEDFSKVTSLEICINTEEDLLCDIGTYFPKLVQLRMNNSVISSVRDLGTSLSHLNLQVLWMSRCCLQDLETIYMFSSIRELYLAYNNVSELSQLGMLENLRLLDLEGNDVDDLVQVQYLGLCSKLRALTLEGNPVCVSPNPTATQKTDYNYRAAVRNLLPQLCYLDDVKVEDNKQGCSSAMWEEWTILRKAIRNSPPPSTEDEKTTNGVRPPSRPGSSRRPPSLSAAGSRPGSRPMSARGPRVFSPPGCSDSDEAVAEADTSTLTHGAGKILFCGNPVQALRARREKMRKTPAKPTSTSCNLLINIPEHTYDPQEPEAITCADVFTELRVWREQHSRRLQAIEREKDDLCKETSPKRRPEKTDIWTAGL